MGVRAGGPPARTPRVTDRGLSSTGTVTCHFVLAIRPRRPHHADRRPPNPPALPPRGPTMKRVLSLCLVAGLLALPGLGVRGEEKKAETKDNTPPPGFTALFNGKDLTNWQGLIPLPERKKLSPEDLAKKQKEVNDKVLPHWTVKDGILSYDGKSNSLQTVKDYGDFELYIDWKIEPKGDSGIYL